MRGQRSSFGFLLLWYGDGQLKVMCVDIFLPAGGVQVRLDTKLVQEIV